jgi:hypothetical protein
MKSDFTSGEWKVYGESNTIYCNGKMVCQFFDKLEDDCENKEANARLISKAPEMLKALIDLVKNGNFFSSAIELDWEFCGKEFKETVIDIIEQAIGKTWEEINEL